MPVRAPFPTKRLQIVSENKVIAASGQYTAPSGRIVTLGTNGEQLSAQTELIDEEIPAKTVPRAEAYHYADHVRQEDTISCILGLRAENVQGEILALNFANANVAGGGYILGGDAQEESLCRNSLLYAAIAPHSEYYHYHRMHPSPLYSDRMLYSPNVPIIRSADGELLETPQMCSFLTSPAVNRRLARPWVSNEKIDAAMQRRIEKIVVFAAKRKPSVLLLGAFGCGVFGNKRETVFPMMEAAVTRYLPQEIRVIFPLP